MLTRTIVAGFIYHSSLRSPVFIFIQLLCLLLGIYVFTMRTSCTALHDDCLAHSQAVIAPSLESLHVPSIYENNIQNLNSQTVQLVFLLAAHLLAPELSRVQHIRASRTIQMLNRMQLRTHRHSHQASMGGGACSSNPYFTSI